MQSASYWLNWKPEIVSLPEVAGGRSGKSNNSGRLEKLTPLPVAKSESSATFATCHLAHTPENRLLIQDPQRWADDFGKWALAECLFLDRCAGGIKTLHDAFCEWCVVNETSGPMVDSFTTLLEDEGFRLDEYGLVYGLVLRVDAGAYSLAVPERATK